MEYKELLQRYIAQEQNTLYDLSCNYLMTAPVPGCEVEFAATKERIAGLERIQMMLDILAAQDVNKEAAHALDQQERQYLGTVQTVKAVTDSVLASLVNVANCGSSQEPGMTDQTPEMQALHATQH